MANPTPEQIEKRKQLEGMGINPYAVSVWTGKTVNEDFDLGLGPDPADAPERFMNKLIERKPLTPEEQAKYDHIYNNEIGVVGWFYDDDTANQGVRDIIKNRSPDEMLDAMEAADPSMKPMLDEIRNDTALAKALHEAVVKDPTVLEGLQKMATKEGMSSTQMAEMLKDQKNREILTGVLTHTGNSDQLKFEDIEMVMASAAGAAANPLDTTANKKYRDKLFQFGGMKDERAELAKDGVVGILENLRDPSKREVALDSIMSMMSFIPEEYRAMFKEMLGGFIDFGVDVYDHVVVGTANVIDVAKDSANARAAAKNSKMEVASATTEEPLVQKADETYSTPPKTNTASLAGSDNDIKVAGIDINAAFGRAVDGPYERPPIPANTPAPAMQFALS